MSLWEEPESHCPVRMEKTHTSAKKAPKCNHANGTLAGKVRMKSSVCEELMEKKEHNGGVAWGRGRGTHHEEGRVHHPPGRGDDLASAAVQRLLRHQRVQDLELDVPDG